MKNNLLILGGLDISPTISAASPPTIQNCCIRWRSGCEDEYEYGNGYGFMRTDTRYYGEYGGQPE